MCNLTFAKLLILCQKKQNYGTMHHSGYCSLVCHVMDFKTILYFSSIKIEKKSRKPQKQVECFFSLMQCTRSILIISNNTERTNKLINQSNYYFSIVRIILYNILSIYCQNSKQVHWKSKVSLQELNWSPYMGISHHLLPSGTLRHHLPQSPTIYINVPPQPPFPTIYHHLPTSITICQH